MITFITLNQLHFISPVSRFQPRVSEREWDEAPEDRGPNEEEIGADRDDAGLKATTPAPISSLATGRQQQRADETPRVQRRRSRQRRRAVGNSSRDSRRRCNAREKRGTAIKRPRHDSGAGPRRFTEMQRRWVEMTKRVVERADSSNGGGTDAHHNDGGIANLKME